MTSVAATFPVAREVEAASFCKASPAQDRRDDAVNVGATCVHSFWHSKPRSRFKGT